MPSIEIVEIVDTRPQLSTVFQFGNVQRHGSTNVFVSVATTDGARGWGEACPVPQLTNRSPEQICGEIAEIAKEHLIGRQVEEIPGLLDSLHQWAGDSVFARAALDTALMDLRAQWLGVTLSELLGGPRRTSLQVHGSIGWDEDAEKMGDGAAHQAVDYSILKTYLGRGQLEDDLGRLKAMRSRIPASVGLIVDINKLWGDDDFSSAAPVLRELGVLAVEQPTLEPTPAVARVGAEHDLMIIWDESIRSPADVASGGFAGPQGTINVGISKLGGPTAARATVTVAEAFGLPVAIGSVVETGIGSIAGAHVAATVAELPLPSYVMGFLKYESQLTSPRLEIVDGVLILPDGPGLGVAIDENAVSEVTVAKEVVR